MNRYIGFFNRIQEETFQALDFDVPRELRGVKTYWNPAWEIRIHAINMAPKSGLFLEFGVWKGETINLFAALIAPKLIYGFDSFFGLPEYWRKGSPAGLFNLNGRIPVVRKNVKLIKGLFDETLPQFTERFRGEKVAFVHIDSDLYTSCRTIFDNLADLDLVGTIILFDEFYNYHGWRTGEYKAFMEFLSKSGYTAQYIGRIKYGNQVIVRLKKRRHMTAAHPAITGA